MLACGAALMMLALPVRAADLAAPPMAAGQGVPMPVPMGSPALSAAAVAAVPAGVNQRAARRSDIAVDVGQLTAALGASGLAGNDGRRAGFGLFADGGWRRRDAGTQGDLARQTVKAAVAGLTYADGDGWRLALGAGPVDGSARFRAGGGFDLSGTAASLQVANTIGALRLSSRLGHAWFDLDGVTRAGALSAPQGDGKGESNSFAFKAAWHVDLDTLFLEPALGVALDEVRVKSYAETNAGGPAIKVDRMKRSDWTAAAGLTLGFHPVELAPGLRLSGQMEAAYIRNLDRPGTATRASFIDNAPRPLSLFVGDGPRDRLMLAPELSLAIGDNAVLSVRYSRQFRGDEAHMVSAGLSWRF